ncbi:MAG: EAL domain-containing protein [Lamprobacter sp.]|uniref:sensor domain-containing protein n=1 Tax=Lamprobacter sp. TaxID=3100796 RepID=UPI002B25DF40|nr:EAL domain-containing protein [Lamprobacter sp.]MEA3641408.1 EAL domain-containing protein [Lamprobacter sp.]
MSTIRERDTKTVGTEDVDRFFSLSLQLLLIADIEGRIRRCNPAWQEQLGWSPDALIGRSFLELVHPDDLTATKAQVASLAAGTPTPRFLNRFRNPHGEWRSLAWSALAAADTQLIYAIGHDVTQQEQALQALRASEQRLREAERIGGLGSWELELSTETLRWSEQIYRLLDLDPAAFQPTYRSFLDMVHPEDRERLDRTFRHSVASHLPFAMAHRVRRADGSIRWLQEFAETQYAEDGTPIRSIGTVQDITEQKHSRLMLALKARRDEALLELPHIADGLSEQAVLQHSLALAEDLTDSAIGFAHFVNEDQTSVEFAAWSMRTLDAGCQVKHDMHYPLQQAGLWADALRQRAPVLINDYPTEADGKGLPEGHIALSRSLVVPVFESGRVRMLLGVGNKASSYDETDVESAQLLANEAWRQAQQTRSWAQLTLADQVLAETHQGVAITDADGALVRVNAAFSRITGYSAEEVLGRNPRLLKSGLHDQAFYCSMWADITRHGCWRGELWNRRKNGEVYPQWLSISAVHDPAGQVGHYVGLFTDLSESKQAQEKIDYLSYHDALTGLSNRALLNERLEHALTRASRSGHLALLNLDLDRFKQVNDTLGHQDGDRLLIEMARRINAKLMPSDTLARLAGDEFALLLEERAEALPVATLARELLTCIAEPVKVADRELVVTASIGISLYPNDGTDVDSLSRHASQALGAVKRMSRNSFQFFDPSLTDGALQRLITEHALRGAVTRNELRLHYQPQVRLSDGALVGAEALLRWQHPNMGMVPPDQFIPLAEEIGVINEIGTWVLEAACQQLADWDRQGLNLTRLAVNLSARQLDEDALASTIATTLEASAIQPQRLELEITESMLMRNPEAARTLLSELKRLGARISIDDFGTGYSSLAMLRLLPLDQLKIDQSFVRDIGADDNDEAIVRTIIAMARTLGLETVAEGIEDADQLAFLVREQVDLGQGYHFAKPLMADQLFAEWSAQPNPSSTCESPESP